jgi:hypothetical protein
VLNDSAVVDGMLTTQVSSFSFFIPVIITYPMPAISFAPLAIGDVNVIDCEGQDCNALVGPSMANVSIATTGSQLPDFCSVGSSPIFLVSGRTAVLVNDKLVISAPLFLSGVDYQAKIYITVTCSAANGLGERLVEFKSIVVGSFVNANYPTIKVLPLPAQVTGVNGQPVLVKVTLMGGAVKSSGIGEFYKPTQIDTATIDWQRSDDDGRSWKNVARSYQYEADPLPVAGTYWGWLYWANTHGFTASAADNGALLRVQACYTPPVVPAPPCVTSNATRLNVISTGAVAAITQAPHSVLVRTGQTASFSTTASGTPAPTLQWQSRPANSFGAWANVSSGMGGTTGNYTTDVLALSDNGLQLRVVATNAVSSVESLPVTVSVSDVDVAPTISTQPGSLNVTTGNDAAFAIAARGTEALSYQWQFNGVSIAGGNSAVLRLATVAAGQAGSYRVVVSNAAGTVTSDAATLTVSAGTPSAVVPTIVTQPVTVVVNVGNTATLAVGVSGTGPFSYQWLLSGAPVTGATAAFYSIPSAAVGDSGSYSVRVSNAAGNVTSSSATLQVNASVQATAPSLTTQPSPQVQTPGGSATFAVAASGTGPISYQWQKDGVSISGATSAVLVVSGINSADAGNYTVTVYNSQGSVTSNAASLTVLGVPAITAQPATATASEGATATFSVQASGTALGHQWMRNQIAISGATSASYTTPTLAMSDSGAVYTVVVYNGAGMAISQGAVLTVMPLVAPGMTLLAGDFSGGGGGGANDSTGIDARFDMPQGLTSDSAGNIFVAQPNGRRVAMISPSAVVTTVLYHPIGIDRNNFGHVSLAPDGSLYTAGVSYCGLFRTEQPFGLTSITTGYTLTGCPGSYTGGVAVNSSGVAFIAMQDANSIIQVSTSDNAGNATAGVFAGGANVYVAPGSSDGTGGNARFNAPRGIVFASNGDMLVADSGNHTIRRISPLGVVTTFAGTAGQKGNVDNTGAAARFNTPAALSFDSGGNLFVLELGDASNNWATYVRRVTPGGVVTTLFNAGDEAAAIAQPAQASFARTIRGMTVLGSNRVALTSGNAVVVRTLN